MENRPSSKRTIIGFGILFVGVAWLLSNLNVIDWNLNKYLFTWELILVFIGLVTIVGKDSKGFGLVMFGVGTVLYIRNVFHFHFELSTIFWPSVLIALGLVFIFKRGLEKKKSKYSQPKDDENVIDDVCIFGGLDKIIKSKAFEGGEVVTIFGGSELDLRHTEMLGDSITIELVNVFAGIKIFVPPNWTTRVQVVSIFGGFSDKSITTADPMEGKKELVIKGVAIFGGGEITN